MDGFHLYAFLLFTSFSLFFFKFLRNYPRNISSETAAILAVLWAKINQLVWGTNKEKTKQFVLGFIVFGYFVSAGPLEEEGNDDNNIILYIWSEWRNTALPDLEQLIVSGKNRRWHLVCCYFLAPPPTLCTFFFSLSCPLNSSVNTQINILYSSIVITLIFLVCRERNVVRWGATFFFNDCVLFPFPFSKFYRTTSDWRF